MTVESDAILARAAGLTTAERYALDDIANGDPRLCKAALYDHAHAIADALSSPRVAELEERIAELASDLENAREEEASAREDRDSAEAQSRIDADDASRYKAFLDELRENLEAL